MVWYDIFAENKPNREKVKQASSERSRGPQLQLDIILSLSMLKVAEQSKSTTVPRTVVHVKNVAPPTPTEQNQAY